MQQKDLLIVFVKNIKLGKVKTRLAKTIGDDAAFKIYKRLVAITEKESEKITATADIHIYFSDVVIDHKWPGRDKFVQVGENLGMRMQGAFQNGFKMGYERIIGIGSDLPDLKAEVMQEGLNALKTSDTVFGPAEDGGYYLIGMSQMFNCIFENKPWSTDALLNLTLTELKERDITYTLLNELNDIDTIEDLKASSVAEQFKHLYELS